MVPRYMAFTLGEPPLGRQNECVGAGRQFLIGSGATGLLQKGVARCSTTFSP